MKLTDKVQGFFARRQTASKMKHAVYAHSKHITAFWNREWQAVSHRRLYIATTVSASLLFATTYTVVNHMNKTEEWAQVYSNGTYVGMVPNNSEVITAMNRLALGYHVDVRFHTVHTHVADDYNWQAVAALPTKAVAIIVNGNAIAYTVDQVTAQRVLAYVKQALTPAQLPQGATVHFLGDVATEPSEVSAGQVMSRDAAIRYILHPASDKLAGRGASFHLIAAAADSPENQPPNGQPMLQVAAEQTVTKVVSLPFSVKYIKDNRLGSGTVKVVTKGKTGQAKQQLALTYVNGKLVGQKVVHQDVVTAPQSEVARQGTNSGVASGDWGWPSASHVVTSPFGWRFGGREFHPGQDIGCPVGTPVYATNNGVVEEAGWNGGGYGIWVKINNGNGIETVFGHMSRVAVHGGETVAKGQLIGYSGSTGHSTGPHLHYEVRKNGTPVQPLPYM